MNIARYKHQSTAEGPWQNTSFWTAGCSIRCKGCFNVALWDPMVGRNISLIQFLNIVLDGRDKGDKGIAIIGGEPFDQPVRLGIFLAAVRLFQPRYKLTVYSGYTLGKLRKKPLNWLALIIIDFLVDGPFIREMANENLGYRGSSNQRVINLTQTRKQHRIILAEWDGLLVLRPEGIHGPPAVMEKFKQPLVSAQCGAHSEKETFSGGKARRSHLA